MRQSTVLILTFLIATIIFILLPMLKVLIRISKFLRMYEKTQTLYSKIEYMLTEKNTKMLDDYIYHLDDERKICLLYLMNKCEKKAQKALQVYEKIGLATFDNAFLNESKDELLDIISKIKMFNWRYSYAIKVEL